MTISSTSHRMDYTGNGATSSYSYNFRIFSDTDLLVTKRDTSNIETTLVLNTDYTVSGAGGSNGSITLTTALALNNHLTIRRVRPLTQGTDIRNQGDFYAEIHEDAFDHFVMIDQQQQEEIDRSIRLPETVTGVDASMPLPEALHWPRWDATGTALENITAANLGSITTVNPSLTLSGSELSVTVPVRQGVAGGTVDAITASVTPAPASLTNNLTVWIETAGANTTTTPTFNLNGLGAKTIVKWGSTALVAGDIRAANDRMILVYDDSLDKWVLLNPASPPAIPGIQSGQYVYSAGAGTDTYTATLVPAITAYTTGMKMLILFTNANTVTTPTLNVNSLGAKTIKRQTGTALVVGDIQASWLALIEYNGTDMILLNPATHDHSANAKGGTLAWQGMPVDVPVQRVISTATTFTDVTTAIPKDNSTPQNTEGTQVLTGSITPKATTDILTVKFDITMSVNHAGGVIVAALFRDSGAGAVFSKPLYSIANAANTWAFEYAVVAGSVSATTFNLRVGNPAGATVTFNGEAGGNLFNGTMISSMTIIESKAS